MAQLSAGWVFVDCMWVRDTSLYSIQPLSMWCHFECDGRNEQSAWNALFILAQIKATTSFYFVLTNRLFDGIRRFLSIEETTALCTFCAEAIAQYYYLPCDSTCKQILNESSIGKSEFEWCTLHTHTHTHCIAAPNRDAERVDEIEFRTAETQTKRNNEIESSTRDREENEEEWRVEGVRRQISNEKISSVSRARDPCRRIWKGNHTHSQSLGVLPSSTRPGYHTIKHRPRLKCVECTSALMELTRSYLSFIIN